MVITVTLNPAMDKTLTIDNFTLGKVNRVTKIRYDIGGKGINVSKVLRNFGIDSNCTGFLGGILKDTFEKELQSNNIKNDFIEVSQNTRTNTKIVDNQNKIYTDVNEAGPIITEFELNSLIEKFKSICSEKDIVVLSGGVSPNVPKNIYGTLTKIAKEKGAFVILDAEGELLREGIKEKPDIIKPNDHEFENLLSKRFDSENDMIYEAKKLIDYGLDKVLISLGEKGAIFVTNGEVIYGKGLKVPVKSTVGAGDSMVAALIYSMINGYNNEETLKFAIATGGVTVSLEGTQACSLEDVKKLIKNVDIEIRR
ncbi:1-phosphofructokinase [Clostridium hydrogenum]|uniref:1-phosphofructokinase n=1 Tax=Clostridium hydrogenum TaxID=2855764 RepID=UPI001F25EA66|nr:1-phosphofructokinase [Clostridium hydrogenum]